jgi:hypothetical protein
MKSSKLPIQSPPVERNIIGTPISSKSGVEASGLLSDIGQWLDDQVGNVVGKIFPI